MPANTLSLLHGQNAQPEGQVKESQSPENTGDKLSLHSSLNKENKEICGQATNIVKYVFSSEH